MDKYKMDKCPWCESDEIQLITLNDCTRKYYCPRCDCYYIPGWMIDENLRILRNANMTE